MNCLVTRGTMRSNTSCSIPTRSGFASGPRVLREFPARETTLLLWIAHLRNLPRAPLQPPHADDRGWCCAADAGLPLVSLAADADGGSVYPVPLALGDGQPGGGSFLWLAGGLGHGLVGVARPNSVSGGLIRVFSTKEWLL